MSSQIPQISFDQVEQLKKKVNLLRIEWDNLKIQDQASPTTKTNAKAAWMSAKIEYECLEKKYKEQKQAQKQNATAAKKEQLEDIEATVMDQFMTQLLANHNGHKWQYGWTDPLEKVWHGFEDLVSFSYESHKLQFKWTDLPVFLCRSGIRFISKNMHLYVYLEPYREILLPEFIGWFISFFYGTNFVNEKGTAGAKELFEAVCSLTNLPLTQFLDTDAVIPYQNGKIDCKTRQFTNYMPQDYITLMLPYKYDPKQKCPLFLYTISQILPEIHKQKILLTYMAYCLTPYLFVRKALMCVGNGHNGKSTPVELLAKILGPLARNVSMQSLIEEENNQVKLRGARINYSSEIAATDFDKCGIESMKDIITTPTLKGRDLYEPRLGPLWPNMCKHIYSANDLPYTDYMTGAIPFFDRWIILEYTQQFDPKTDPELFADLYEYEASGILTYLLSITDFSCLEGIKGREIREQWVSNGLSMIKFMHDVGIVNAESTPVDDFYKSYQDWCWMYYGDLAKELTYKRHTFFKHLTNQGYKIDTKRRYEGSDGERQIYSSKRVIYDVGFDPELSKKYWSAKDPQIKTRVDRMDYDCPVPIKDKDKKGDVLKQIHDYDDQPFSPEDILASLAGINDLKLPEVVGILRDLRGQGITIHSESPLLFVKTPPKKKGTLD